jgi:hypothetical protein
MRSVRATNNFIAVSANNREADINSPQDLDTTLLVALGDVLNVEPRRESNADEATGKEEPDMMYDNGQLSGGSFNFEKAQPQHFAFLAAFGLGEVATTPAGTGFLHTITPIEEDLLTYLSNPSFTAAQRYGKTVLKRLFATVVVDSFTFTFAEDSWCKAVGSLKGTGMVEDNIDEALVNAAKNAISLTLPSAVHGDDASERLDNVHRVRAELSPGVWTEVTFTAVGGAGFDELTIVAPDEATDLVDYKILYVPTEPAWCAFPPRVQESPLRVSQLTAVIGGTWDGTSFAGGREVSADVKNLEWSMNNNLQVTFAPGAGGGYASKVSRDGRSQTLQLDRDFRDAILQQAQTANEYFGIRVIAEGAEFDTGHKFQVEIIFPRVGIESAPLSLDGKKLSENTAFQVLQDDTHGSVIVRVKNQVAAYAA